jgi:hypothetical protein
MIRGESFSGGSQLTSKSSFIGTDFDGAGDALPDGGDANPYVLYLKSKGKLTLKINQVQEGGKLLTIWNYPLRNKLWPIRFADIHMPSGNFALADNRGQVYHVSWADREYESVKLASKAVSAIAFLQGFKNILIVSYENGTTVAINTKTKEIVANIQLPQAKSRIKFIRSHPRRPFLIFVTEDHCVYLWNMG